MQREQLSVFDMFKIGIGPSSSHTLGPWRAAQQFVQMLEQQQLLELVTGIKILLYGSLAKTGKGHGTDIAIMLGLSGDDPVTFDVNKIISKIDEINTIKKLWIDAKQIIDFNPQEDIDFLFTENLPYHPNAVTFLASLNNGENIAETYYSIGGGFVKKEGEELSGNSVVQLPFPINTANDLLHWCMMTGMNIYEVVMENENMW